MSNIANEYMLTAEQTLILDDVGKLRCQLLAMRTSEILQLLTNPNGLAHAVFGATIEEVGLEYETSAIEQRVELAYLALADELDRRCPPPITPQSIARTMQRIKSEANGERGVVVLSCDAVLPSGQQKRASVEVPLGDTARAANVRDLIARMVIEVEWFGDTRASETAALALANATAGDAPQE